MKLKNWILAGTMALTLGTGALIGIQPDFHYAAHASGEEDFVPPARQERRATWEKEHWSFDLHFDRTIVEKPDRKNDSGEQHIPTPLPHFPVDCPGNHTKPMPKPQPEPMPEPLPEPVPEPYPLPEPYPMPRPQPVPFQG